MSRLDCTMICLIWLTITVAMITSLNINEQLERDEIIDFVNNAKTTWKAGRNFNPTFKKEYIKHLLGLKKTRDGMSLPAYEAKEQDNIELPKNFDSRQKWENCTFLQQIRDQGPCGSCWAVGAASAFTDRLCIASGYSFNGHLSVEELLTCCSSCGMGCNGGDDDAAWRYFEENGIVTGGDYHSKEGCQPYMLPPCEHHVPGPRKNCSSYPDVTPPCYSKCTNRKYHTHSFKDDHHKIKEPFTITNDNLQVQHELFKHGPLEAGFAVYEDFLSYKSGVYQHSTGPFLGGHAVKLIGWGEEQGVSYWLVANSWNTDWGDKGFFKIKRGDNECGFEDDISGGYPIV